MCCHNGPGAQQVLGALRAVDPTITGKDSSFWHKTLGSTGGGTAPAPTESTMQAVDAAWVAATKNNKNWGAMSARDRLDASENFRSLRAKVEDGSLTLTENQVLKLGTYVTRKKKAPTVKKVGVLASALLVGALAGSTPVAAAENSDGPREQTTISAQHDVTDGHYSHLQHRSGWRLGGTN